MSYNTYMMIEANILATVNRAFDYLRGGPFGAVIVKDGEIIARGRNSVLEHNDPTAHAEIQAIRSACKKLGTHDLSGCELYTSCYPCPMCLSAIVWANIKTVYYGNTKEDAADIGFRDDMIYSMLTDMDKQQLIQIEQHDRDITIKEFHHFKEASEENDDMIY